MEKQIQKDMAAGLYKKVLLTPAKRAEFRKAAKNTLDRLEGVDVIRKIRADLHLSQPALARALRVSPKTVKSWEGGQRNVSETALCLARLLHEVPAVRKRLLAA